MKSLSKPFNDAKNQVVFLTFGLFWINNIGVFIERVYLKRLLIYPIYIIILLLFIYLFFTMSREKNNMDTASYSMLWVLAVLGFASVVRGTIFYNNTITIPYIRSLFFGDRSAIIIWLMPLSLLYGLKKEFWFTWLPRLRIILIFGCLYVFSVMLLGIYSKDIIAKKMYNSTDFLFISAFLIIFSIYKPNKMNIFIGYLGTILLTVHMFLNDERFAIAYIGLMFIFYILAIFLEQYQLNLKVFILYVGLLLLISTIFIAFQIPIIESYISKYFIQGEMWVDTRGDGLMREAVTHGMSTFEYAFGKGIWGTYVMGYHGWPPVLYVRDLVEMGFMHIILKNGYVMLISFLFLSIYSAYLGIFRSKNKITRFLAFIIIARLILMFTAMAPRVGFEYFMYWVVVGGCLSPQLRAIDDSTIKNNCEIKRQFVISW